MTVPFRDDAQRAEVCRALLATGDLHSLWTDRGPTDEAAALAKDGALSLQRGERALVLAAWALWTGEPTILRYDELIGLPQAEPIAKLTVAMLYGPDAVDVWLTRAGATEAYARTVADVHQSAANLFDEARASFAECESEAMNFTAPADACAVGALRMAQYLLLDGVDPIAHGARRNREAIELTIHVLTLSAAMEHERAKKARKSRTRRPRPKDGDLQ